MQDGARPLRAYLGDTKHAVSGALQVDMLVAVADGCTQLEENPLTKLGHRGSGDGISADSRRSPTRHRVLARIRAIPQINSHDGGDLESRAGPEGRAGALPAPAWRTGWDANESAVVCGLF